MSANVIPETPPAIVVEVAHPDIERWSTKITARLSASVAEIIAIGDDLIAAKDELAHGLFGPMLAEVGMSRQRANMYMRIANSTPIRDRQPVGGLPTSVSTLDVLTQLDAFQFHEYLDAGEITPSTTRAEAQELVERARAPISELVTLATGLAAAVTAVDEVIDAAVGSIQHRDHFRDMSLIVKLALVYSTEFQGTRDEYRRGVVGLHEFMAEHVGAPCTDAPNWLMAMPWIGDQHGLHIDRPFSEQLIERYGADDLEHAAFKWFTEEDPEEAS